MCAIDLNGPTKHGCLYFADSACHAGNGAFRLRYTALLPDVPAVQATGPAAITFVATRRKGIRTTCVCTTRLCIQPSQVPRSPDSPNELLRSGKGVRRFRCHMHEAEAKAERLRYQARFPLRGLRFDCRLAPIAGSECAVLAAILPAIVSPSADSTVAEASAWPRFGQEDFARYITRSTKARV